MKYFNPKYLQRPGKARTDFSTTKTQPGTNYNTQSGSKPRLENSRDPKGPAKSKTPVQEPPKSATKIDPSQMKHGSKIENKLPIKADPKPSLLAEKSASNLPPPKKSDIAKLLQTVEQHNRAETFSNVSQPQPPAKDAKKSVQPDHLFDTDMRKKSQINYDAFDGPAQEGPRRNSKPRDSKKPISETRITPVEDVKSVYTQVHGKFGNNPSEMDLRAMKLDELKKKPPGQLTPQEKEMLKLLSKKKI